MKDARQEYECGLADFARPHNRWQGLEAVRGRPTFVWWGKCAGLTAEEIIEDAHAHGVTNRDDRIRSAWDTAHPNGGDRPLGKWRRSSRTKPKPPPTFPRYVRDMVAAGGGEATSADLRAMSPYDVTHGRENGNQQLLRAVFFKALFSPDDLLFVDKSDVHQRGVLGANIRTADEWARLTCLGAGCDGDLIVPNSFTGAEGVTANGQKTYIGQSCLARFPFAVIEFDAMPLKQQAAFWRGLLMRSPLAPKVAAITHSGGKSLHGLLYIGARDLADWKMETDRLRRLMCTHDPDPTYRADPAGLTSPRQATRLAGVRRLGDKAKGGGNLQRLMYLNPDAVRSSAT